MEPSGVGLGGKFIEDVFNLSLGVRLGLPPFFLPDVAGQVVFVAVVPVEDAPVGLAGGGAASVQAEQDIDTGFFVAAVGVLVPGLDFPLPCFFTGVEPAGELVTVYEADKDKDFWDCLVVRLVLVLFIQK